MTMTNKELDEIIKQAVVQAVVNAMIEISCKRIGITRDEFESLFIKEPQ